jgi:hypothetical protein
MSFGKMLTFFLATVFMIMMVFAVVYGLLLTGNATGVLQKM